MPPLDGPMGKSVGRFLYFDWWRKAQPTGDSAALGQVVLGCVRGQTEQAMESESVNSTPPWFLLPFLPPGSCRNSLSDGLWPESCKRNVFFLKLVLVRFFVCLFYHSNRNSSYSSQQDGSASKNTCPRPVDPGWIPRTHEVEGKNWHW